MIRLNKTAATAVTAVMMTGATVGVIGATTSAADAAGTCPNNNHSNKENTVYNANFAVINVPIRTGNAAACTALGQGQPTDGTRLHCYRWNGVNYWDYLKNTRTKVVGWVVESKLNHVSVYAC